MHEWEDAALPEGVAAVDELVGAALEAALLPHLPVRRPPQQPLRVAQPGLPHQHQRGQAAEAVNDNTSCCGPCL